MSWEAWYAVGTIVAVIIALATNRVNVDTGMVGGLLLLLVGDALLPGDILAVEDGIRGFAHPAIIMIGALFVVAAGLQETGGMELVARRLLGRPRTVAGAQLRLMAPVAFMSAFMNNTPIVAMYVPIVADWARKLRISPSKLFLPLSFAAILGGKITLIGTASNIVVMEEYVKQVPVLLAGEAAGTEPVWLSELGVEVRSSRWQFWGIAGLGVATSVAGIALILLLSRWLLPERRPSEESPLDSRRYQVELLVRPDSPIIGKSIEEAGLRQLPGLYLTQIEREHVILPAVAPDEVIHANDVLAFAGILESVVDLRKIRGLVPATDQVEKIDAEQRHRTLVEAVISRNSPLVGKTVRASQFRTRFNAAIIAVHRNAEVIHAKIGDIVLQPGDTLLLDTHSGFVGAFRNSDSFYLVSPVSGSRPIRHERAGIALSVLGIVVVMLTVSPIAPVTAALTGAGLMVLTRCISGTVARSAINWQVLLVIGSAIGMGAALKQTGAADGIVQGLISVCHGFGPHAMLLVVFTLATLFAQLITNNGAAVLMFPIAMVTARDLGVHPEAFIFTLMVAAGSTFLSPVSYQTNLLVYGPGGYRFLDYARLGLPLTIVLAVICTAVAPLLYPFGGPS
ncbi:MAG: SLC13 family permease [Planctomycetes bacterium]|nr:SLC13 family permease [Planctomycetota bacterium]